MNKLWMSFSETNDGGQIEPFEAAAKEKGIYFKTFYTEYFKFDDDKAFYKGKLIDANTLPQVFLLRGIGEHGPEIHKYFEKHGVRVINNAKVHNNSNDKLKMHKLMEKNGVSQPKTNFYGSNIAYPDLVKELGDTFVAKDRYGQCGIGVFLIKSQKDLDEAYRSLPADGILFQEFIKESKGKDLRTYIVGDKVVGGLIRDNNSSDPNGDFRSNIAKGGKAYEYNLTKEQEQNSLKIAKILNGEIISVDYLLKGNELLFCEANTNAGIKSFVQLGFPIADSIMTYVQKALKEIELNAEKNPAKLKTPNIGKKSIEDKSKK